HGPICPLGPIRPVAGPAADSIRPDIHRSAGLGLRAPRAAPDRSVRTDTKKQSGIRPAVGDRASALRGMKLCVDVWLLVRAAIRREVTAYSYRPTLLAKGGE